MFESSSGRPLRGGFLSARRSVRGYSFVELLLSVALISLIGAFVFAKFGGAREEAYLAAMKNDLHRYALQQELRWHQGGGFAVSPEDMGDFVLSEDVRVVSAAGDRHRWTMAVGHERSDSECMIALGSMDTGDVEGKIRCTSDFVSFAVSNDDPMAGEPVEFDATFAVAEMVAYESHGWIVERAYAAEAADIAEVRWSFGDGAATVGGPETSLVVEHAYDVERDTTFTVDLSIEAKSGRTARGLKVVRVRVADDGSVEDDNLYPRVYFTHSNTEVQSGDEVSFDASDSFDPEGGELDFYWDFGDGTSAVGPSVTHTFDGKGRRLVTLVVTDERGASTVADVAVRVHPNASPVAVANVEPIEVRVGEVVGMDAGGSYDEDGRIVAAFWQTGDGTGLDGMTGEHRFAQPGAYTVELTVADEQGAVGTAERTVVVRPLNQTPSIAFTVSADPAEVAQDVNFDAGASFDPDGDAIDIEWHIADDDMVRGAQVTRSFAAVGSYPIRLVVRDEHGDSAVLERAIDVVENHSPVAVLDVDRDVAEVGESIRFDASDSYDPEGADLVFAWDFGDWSSASEPVVERSFDVPGTFMVRLSVTDDFGHTVTTERSITIRALNGAPVAVLGVSREVVRPGEPVVLFGFNSTDVDGRLVGWSWDLAEGVGASGEVVTRTFAAEGVYAVGLTVTDDGGATHSVTRAIEVADTEPPSVDSYAELLWPPNDSYHVINVEAHISDTYDMEPSLVALAVSDEADDGSGDGSTDGDVRVTLAGGEVVSSTESAPVVRFHPATDRLELRAERSGAGPGRRYWVTVVGNDRSGNETTRTLSVFVPHDRARKDP